MSYEELSVTDLAALLEEGDAPYLLDVREVGEWEVGHLEGATLLPMSTIAQQGPDALPEDMPRDSLVVVYCRSGGRSARVASFLVDQGFDEVANLEGGMMAWADEIDSSFEVG